MAPSGCGGKAYYNPEDEIYSVIVPDVIRHALNENSEDAAHKGNGYELCFACFKFVKGKYALRVQQNNE